MARRAKGARMQSGGATGSQDRVVTILMGVYNGAAHLPQQLDSFAAQADAQWQLVASDDGSRDDSGTVMAAFAAAQPGGAVRLMRGPGQGFARNYLAMLRSLPAQPGWLAFADQDDVWLPHRLSAGLQALGDGTDMAMYCSRTLIWNDETGAQRLSRPRPRPPGFRNALVQNIAAGNTILLTPAAAALLAAAAAKTDDVVAHDWWAYLLITGAGGRVVHGDAPQLKYRQHGGNVIGSNDGVMSKLRRLMMLSNGTMRGWTDSNLAALAQVRDRLTPEAQDLIARMQAMRATKGLWARLRAFWSLGLYRQTRSSTLALWLAVLTRRL